VTRISRVKGAICHPLPDGWLGLRVCDLSFIYCHLLLVMMVEFLSRHLATTRSL